MKMAEDEVGENGKAVIRRYEYFKYTGAYDAEHEPLTLFLDTDLLEPPAGELGNFIARKHGGCESSRCARTFDVGTAALWTRSRRRAKPTSPTWSTRTFET